MKYIVECEKLMKCIYVVDAEDDEQCHEKLVNGQYEKKVEIDETDHHHGYYGFKYGGYAYKNVEKYSGEGEEKVICSINDLCDALDTTVNLIERDMFKYTACGMPISWDENGVTLVGYAEGADCDMPTSVLLFPFTMKEFNSTVEYLEEEADELWHMWNDPESPGYAITEYDGMGIYEIQKTDEEDVFETDEEAVEQAILDGVKIIPVDELPEKFDRRYLGWIDTPENRKAIAEYTERMCK